MNRSRLNTIAWFSLQCAAVSLAMLGVHLAATAEPPPDRLVAPPSRFDRWTSDNGLPQSSVYSIVQTRDGYIWFTTLDGLVRYDGVRFTVYNARNTPGLAGNRFLCLCEAHDGTLWIGSEDGVVYAFKDQAAAIYRIDGGDESHIVAIRESRDGVVWILTARGVYRLGPGERVPLASAFGMPPDSRADSLTNFVYFSDSTLATFSDDGIVVYGPEDGLPDLNGAKVAEDQQGRVWIQTGSGQMFTIEAGTVKPLRLRVPVPPSRDVMPCCVDRRGNTWIGLYRLGLMRFDPTGGSVLYTAADGYDASYRILTIFEDREGNIWIGSDGGLYRFKDDLVSTISRRDGLPGDNTNVVLEDRRGRIWVGGEGFLSGYGEGKVTRFRPIEKDDGRASALMEDREGRLWIGTRSSGYPIYRIRDSHLEGLSIPGLLEQGIVNALLEDREGTIWVGTSERLARLTPDGGFEPFTAADGLAGNDVHALIEDPGGGLWVGSYGGLSRIEHGRLTPFPEQAGFSGERIRSLYLDGDGVLWVGTYDRGLIRYKEGRLTRYDTRTGLFSDGVFAILEDGAGSLWMSCNSGIYRVRKQQLDAVAEGTLARISSVSYGRDDGLLRSECNGGKQPAAIRARDGRMYFASQGGVAVIDPRANPYNTTVPSVHIEDVFSGTTRLERASGLRIEPGVDNVAIRYSCPSFVKPDLVRFKYRLEGLDEDWVDAGTKREAYYTYLPPGDYTFLVTAANCDGVWSSEPARLAVVAVAPLWRTRSAYALYAIALGGCVYGGVRLRTRQLRRRSLELEQLIALRTVELGGKAEELSEMVERLRRSEHAAHQAKEEALEANRAKSLFLSNMSHELRTPLNALLGFAQLMNRDTYRSADDRESLEIIHRSGRHLLGLINDVLSISKIEAGKLSLADEPFDLRSMLTTVEAMMQIRAESKGLALVFDLRSDLPVAVHGDQGKLRQVLVNLIGNAVKFTDRGSVVLRVRWKGESQRVLFEVEDTGQGIAESEMAYLFEPFVQTETGSNAKEGTGLGLTISRQLVRLMGGEIRVRSDVGKGTTFGFDVSLPVADSSSTPAETRRVVGLSPDQPIPRVLVVDDTLENRKLLARLLESVGFDVREATNGREAVETWRLWRPDLIWMDMRMPVMDGRAAIERIRSEEAARRRPPDAWEDGAAAEADAQNSPAGSWPPAAGGCKIIALTASAFEHQRAEILAIGADDFVAKPFQEGAIFEALVRHCGVRFVYAEEPSKPAGAESSLTTERLAALPGQCREELYEALLVGDGVEASKVVERVRGIDEELAAELSAAIRGFAFDRILEPLEAATSRPSPEQS